MSVKTISLSEETKIKDLLKVLQPNLDEISTEDLLDELLERAEKRIHSVKKDVEMGGNCIAIGICIDMINSIKATDLF